jgi:adenine/guanine phosphoribosyltransferase-like PRPP-binding protein
MSGVIAGGAESAGSLAEFCGGTALGAAAFFRQPENNGRRKANTSMARKEWTMNLFVLIFPTSAKPEHR